ncbi:uncharacterized protein VICG_00907 [Vittaforma corneae ATCC 50505]|uniref:SAC domain-containing protein n=1 Tax=Vittaforma corneae (strain ATCC 50505) TaxID=993615 RepID=L2GMD6_VITCO|nr:uncharacterized protein VICG_00907 [Vittaforma corneae ATCC 50505]ELA42058.1 hypothetical protein VICG_00907 [Vittaforma corneae ATCC 50505]
MKTLLFDTDTKQVSYEGPDGFVNIPDNKACLTPSENVVSYPFLCVLGIIKTCSESKYLFFCSESESLGTFHKDEIFTVLRVSYLPLTDSVQDEMAENVKNLIENLNFYYTFESVEEHFLWNGDMIKNFKEHVSSDCAVSEADTSSAKSLSVGDIPYKFKNIKSQNRAMRSPFSNRFAQAEPKSIDFGKMVIGNMICGYFESRSIRENGMLYFLKILSRISIKKIGTRMLSRGVDELGKVSFFVETKFVTKSDSERVEFVILRGSVPLYWSQDDPLKPHKIIFDENKEKNGKAFKQHLEKLQRGYGRIVIVDLLGHRKYEKILSKRYKDLCLENNVDYVHFDLNKYAENIENIKTTFYKQLNAFMIELRNRERGSSDLKYQDIGYKQESVCEDFDIHTPSFISSVDQESIPINTDNFSSERLESENGWSEDSIQEPDSSSFSVTSPQCDFNDVKVTFRVNCMDCLDRTNIAQYLIFNFFDTFKFSVARSMWVNNGNALSKMYTGSDALKSELHAKGKLSVLGRMSDLVISANRMINNRFTDRDKQNVIDMILGKKSS